MKANPGLARPNVDGWLLTDQVYTIFAKGKQNDVATIDRIECGRRYRVHSANQSRDVSGSG